MRTTTSAHKYLQGLALGPQGDAVTLEGRFIQHSPLKRKGIGGALISNYDLQRCAVCDLGQLDLLMLEASKLEAPKA